MNLDRGPPTIGMVVFDPLTTGEEAVLRAHLTSGRYKQGVIYRPGVNALYGGKPRRR